MGRRFVGLNLVDLDRFVLVERRTGRCFAPNPDLAHRPDLPFEERWVEIGVEISQEPAPEALP